MAIGNAIGTQHDSTDDPMMHSLYNTLTDNGIRLTIRRGILRVSIHLYNNEEDVDRLLDIARIWRNKQTT